MTDALQIIERLKNENEKIDTTDCQREANELRIKWLTALSEERVVSPPIQSKDIVMEHLKAQYLNSKAINQSSDNMKLIQPSSL